MSNRSETTEADAGEFFLGGWWVPEDGGWRPATDCECAAEIRRLRPVERAARDLLRAIDSRPGDDLGQQAAADAWIALRKALADE